MRNIYSIFIFISLSVVILTSCIGNKDANHEEYEGIRINNEVYQELNNEDIQKFIEENNIKPLGVDTLYGYNTVFIFGDLYTNGYYEVYKKDNVVSQGRKVVGKGDWSNAGPVVFGGGTASGDYPFLVIHILDDKLINNGYAIDIIGKNSSIKKDIIKKAFAIETKSIGSINSYRVIDSNEDKIDITLYLYGPDDYHNPIEKKVISTSKERYENNMSEALNDVFEETRIRINSTAVDKEAHCITVDIPQEVAMKFNAGSTAGAILTNELIMTILNLPDIQSAIITVDGEKDSYSDHYSFKGRFTKDKESGIVIRK